MKYEVVRTAEREPTIGSRKLAETFQCGRTQIQTIHKGSIMQSLYESNSNDKLLQCRKRTRISEYAAINEALYKCYLLATARNIFPDEKILVEKAECGRFH